jgi:hypothetical protein
VIEIERVWGWWMTGDEVFVGGWIHMYPIYTKIDAFCVDVIDDVV